MAVLPLLAGETSTTGATTQTVVSIPLDDGFFAYLAINVAGELVGTPATAYGWHNVALVSCAAGVAAVQDEGTPDVIDPTVAGVAVALTPNGASIDVEVTGVALENWRWAGSIS